MNFTGNKFNELQSKLRRNEEMQAEEESQMMMKNLQVLKQNKKMIITAIYLKCQI